MNEVWVIESFSGGGYWSATTQEFLDLSLATYYANKQQAVTALNNNVAGVRNGFFDIYSLYNNPAPAVLNNNLKTTK